MCLHTGLGNEDTQYTMDGWYGTKYYRKRTIGADVNILQQCEIAAVKGNQMLGLIRRNSVQGKRTNHTAVQKNSFASFRILYTSMEAIWQEIY